MFYVKLFNDTGFNLVNVPDSIDLLLNQFTPSQYIVSDVDILQVYHNTKIKLHVPRGEEDVAAADFLLLSNQENITSSSRVAAYIINSYTMTSADTVTLDVVMEPFLTAGGVGRISFLDGMTERHHVARDEDVFGKYFEEDPMLQPSQCSVIEFKANMFADEGPYTGGVIAQTVGFEADPMFVVQQRLNWAIDNDGQNITQILAANNPTTPGNHLENGTEISSWNIHQCQVAMLPDHEACRCGGAAGGLGDAYSSFNTLIMAESPSEAYTDDEGTQLETFSNFQKKIKSLYDWNLQGLVKSCYYVDSFWFQNALYKKVTPRTGDGVVGEIIRQKPLKVVASIHRMWAYDWNSSHQTVWKQERYKKFNKRVWSGKHFQFIFVASGSGDMITKNPETIWGMNAKVAFNAYNPSDTAFTTFCEMNPPSESERNLVIFGWADPRFGGCPKFHIVSTDDQYTSKTFMGQTLDGFTIKDSIKGGIWTPLDVATYGSPGLGAKNMSYQSKKALADRVAGIENGFDTEFDINTIPLVGAIGDEEFDKFANSVVSKGQDIFSRKNRLDKLYGTGTAPASFGMTSSTQMSDWEEANKVGDERAKNLLQRELQARDEAVQYAAGYVEKPIVAFSGSGNIDVAGNGLLIFQMRPSENDLVKYNKILNQYGYKISEPITKSMLANRPSYNYIKALGVSIGPNSKVPKSVRDELSKAFSQGLRIWHKKPDPTLYALDDGGNVPQEVNENV